MISRRAFLFGSAAVVAAASLPAVVQEIAAEPAVLRAPWPHRYVGLNAGGLVQFLPPCDQSVQFQLFVDRNGVLAEYPIFQYALNWRGSLRWTAIPDGSADIVVRENDRLRIEAENPPEDFRIFLSGLPVAENFIWQKGVLVSRTTIPMDLGELYDPPL